MNSSNSLPLESINTLHTLKSIYPDNCVASCLNQLFENDVLLLTNAGVNNLLICDFTKKLANKDIHVFVLDEDLNARNINSKTYESITYEQWIDLSIHAKRIINWF